MASSWRVGDRAECYSVTHGAWCKCDIIELKSEGVIVRYQAPNGPLG